jgi:hypothetical protein
VEALLVRVSLRLLSLRLTPLALLFSEYLFTLFRAGLWPFSPGYLLPILLEICSCAVAALRFADLMTTVA